MIGGVEHIFFKSKRIGIVQPRVKKTLSWGNYGFQYQWWANKKDSQEFLQEHVVQVQVARRYGLEEWV